MPGSYKSRPPALASPSPRHGLTVHPCCGPGRNHPPFWGRILFPRFRVPLRLSAGSRVACTLCGLCRSCCERRCINTSRTGLGASGLLLEVSQSSHPVVLGLNLEAAPWGFPRRLYRYIPANGTRVPSASRPRKHSFRLSDSSLWTRPFGDTIQPITHLTELSRHTEGQEQPLRPTGLQTFSEP